MKHLSLSLAIALLGLGCAGEPEDSSLGGTPSNGGGGSAPSDGGTGGTGGAPVGGSPDGGNGGGSACAQDCSTIDTPVCYVATCNEQTGNCEIGQAEDGASCDDGLFCTVNDTCEAGECQPGEPYVCKGKEDECVLLECDEDLDACTGGSVPNGQPCTSPNVCETNAICQNGTCQGAPTDCSAFPAPDCNASACNPANGQCEPVADISQNGAACDDGGDPCEVQKTCAAGACGNGVPKDCSALDIGCQNGVCNAVTGICEGVAVPVGGSCNSGTDDCNTGVCNAAQQCVLTPVANGTACDDFSTCSINDVCTNGTCGGTVDPLCSVYLEQNFESCPAPGWVLSGEWQCGQPTVVGPPAAFEGSNVIGTILNGNYANSQTYEVDFAQTPPIGLGTSLVPTLTYQHWVSTEGFTYDGYNIKISTDGGVTWNVLTDVSPAYNLTIGGQPAWGGSTFANVWSPVSADLTPWAGQQIMLRFSFRTDGSVVYPGVYIDDVQVGEGAVQPLNILTTSLPSVLPPASYSAPLSWDGGTSQAQWSIVAGSNIAWLDIDPDTGVLFGTPTAANVGPVSVTVHVEEPSDPSNFDEATFTFNVQSGVYSYGFEGACPGGWTLTGDWQCGVPTSGPGSAHGGSNVIATVLAGNYNNNQAYATTTATSPAIDLSTATSPVLQFWVWYLTESGFDGFNVKASSDGVNYTQLLNVTPVYNQTLASEQCWAGTSGGWVLYEADMSAFAGDQVNLRFAFRSDGSVVNPGVYIDDLVILD